MKFKKLLITIFFILLIIIVLSLFYNSGFCKSQIIIGEDYGAYIPSTFNCDNWLVEFKHWLLGV